MIVKPFSFLKFLFYHPCGVAFISSNMVSFSFMASHTFHQHHFCQLHEILLSPKDKPFHFTGDLCRINTELLAIILNNQERLHIFSSLKMCSPSFPRPKFYVIPTMCIFPEYHTVERFSLIWSSSNVIMVSKEHSSFLKILYLKSLKNLKRGLI